MKNLRVNNFIYVILVLICILGCSSNTSKNDEKGEVMNKKTCLSDLCDFSDEELKKRLTPEQYRIVRENGTEKAFENKYWDNKKEGIYVDIVSGEPLFSSKEKYKSETGWPSFYAPLKKENIVEKEDKSFLTTRTEVRSKKGDSHLGHVFDDGPAPTGKRYCINSGALRFIPVEDLEKEGYGKYKKFFEKDESEKAMNKNTEIAMFGAGCFWGVEAAFCKIKGVIKTEVGYSGGKTEKPTYKEVCSDKTGHAEVIRIEYDPSIVSYDELLDVFWNIHDPTQRNRQGPDIGSQYRSVIYYYSHKQKELAELSKEQLEKIGKYNREIVTEIKPAKGFTKAEDYHQKYLEKQGKSSCGI